MIHGIHHVTAIAGDAQRNVDFYAGTLGLRLVKRTVNFDDPGTYHLYYGDGLGRPGTILTFFPWKGAIRGRIGQGQVIETTLAVPDGALTYWRERLKEHGVAVHDMEDELIFADPDGMRLSMIESGLLSDGYGPVPAQYAISRIDHVSLGSADPMGTLETVQAIMGLDVVTGPAQLAPDSEKLPRGTMGPGAVHHVAFRVADDATELEWREKLLDQGYQVSEVMDRQYFHSIYFREPGGILFEIATDPPGFTTDETLEELGTKLQLPPWLEPHRDQIEKALPPLEIKSK
ncbi:MAG: ring-cleaving dioxygenase [Armatimonadaceae bacterium]